MSDEPKAGTIVPKVFILHGMTPKIWPLLSECVERGARVGLNRAEKYDLTDPEQITDKITDAVMNEIADAFDFPEIPQ